VISSPFVSKSRLGVTAFALGVSLTSGCTPPDASRAERVPDGPVPSAHAGIWVDHTEALLDSTASWTNKVELADLNGDGMLDLLFANGGNYSTPGEPEMNRACLNAGPGERFIDATEAVFGVTPDLTRVIKVRDTNDDGFMDVLVGNTYQTRTRLFLGQGEGRFVERPDRIPATDMSVGDAEFGDVDGDGDLDIALATWGAGNSMSNAGGRTRVWINDGQGRYTDESDARMPGTLIGFSWDMELVDVDNDLDLDALVSCKMCSGSHLFRNDGTGVFEADRRGLPQYTNNYEFEPMDLDGDDFLDLVTINDGDIVGEVGSSRREHLFRNDGEGRFRDATDVLWPAADNIGEDDNVVAYLDFDQDGDADFLIGSLSGADRLLINDGSGGLTVVLDAFEGEETPGTLGMAIGDLDGDGRIDVVQSQGEHSTAVQERIHLGTGLVADTAPPSVSVVSAVEVDGELLVRARVHDRKSPSLPTEWQSVEVLYQVMSAPRAVDMRWYGEYLWRALVPPEAESIEVCATDAAGNTSCAEVSDASGSDGPPGSDAAGNEDPGGA
jgi:hypothetical protein